MFIQTEETPNPSALKFIFEHNIINDISLDFNNIAEVGKKSSLALKLFNIKGIKRVFFMQNFITITKKGRYTWGTLKAQILRILADHFLAGLTAIEEGFILQDLKSSNKHFSKIENQIIEVIDKHIRPSVAADGGDVIYHSFIDGIVKLKLIGSCSGCPSSSITLKNGIESLLKYFVPEVEIVETLDEF